MKPIALVFLIAVSAYAEVKTMTLQQALQTALQQSPDLVLARLDQDRARYQVTIARDPFVPKVIAGSGAAKVFGYPNPINGNAPSIVQAQTLMEIFNRPQSYQVAIAGENLRGAGLDLAKKQEQVVYRVGSLYLDAEQAARSVTVAERELDNLKRVFELVKERVAEGRDLPIKTQEANVAVLRGQQRVENLTDDMLNAETSLAVALGMTADDRIRPAAQESTELPSIDTEDSAIAAALETSPELKRLESSMQAKTLEVKSYKAQRLPTVDLVAQYSLLAKTDYTEALAKFQHNNGEIGASIQVPLLAGKSARAYASQAEVDLEKMRAQVTQTRNRIATDLRKSYQDVHKAETARDLAKADLDLAREEISVDLAQNEEGRLPISALESARAVENEKWIAYYDSLHSLDVARLNVLYQTGKLLASVTSGTPGK